MEMKLVPTYIWKTYFKYKKDILRNTSFPIFALLLLSLEGLKYIFNV